MDNLRGNPTDLITVPHTRITGQREDGSAKGYGYFGPVALRGDEECYSTELPYKVGTGVWIPLIVPTLTRAELTHLVAGGRPTEEIRDKARWYANTRAANGLPAFATIDERAHPLPE